MVKRTLYEAAWILGLIAGIVCILFAIFSFLGYIPEILERPIKGLTGIVSASVLGILGFLILGAARMTKAGGKKAAIAILTGLLAIITRYV
jgi:hypothetical protein